MLVIKSPAGLATGEALDGSDCASVSSENSQNNLHPQVISAAPPGETADEYPAVAASGRWRVVRCKDDIQFIAQYRHAGSAKWPWRALAYVVNENLLPGVLERPSLGIPADHLDRLLAAWVAR